MTFDQALQLLNIHASGNETLVVERMSHGWEATVIQGKPAVPCLEHRRSVAIASGMRVDTLESWTTHGDSGRIKGRGER